MSTSTTTSFEFDVKHNGEFKLNLLTYQDGSVLNINVPAMDFEDMVSYLKRKITRRFTTLYYTLPPNKMLLCMKAIKNDYDTNVMYDIAKVAGNLQIYISYHPIDLSTVLIPNDGSLEESFAARQTLLRRLKKELEVEVTLANKLSCELTRVAEQMRSREIHMTMLHDMPIMKERTQPKTRKKKGIDTFLDPFQMIVSELKTDFKKWEIILSENADSTCLGLRMMSRLSLKYDMPLRDKKSLH
ncbi:hypothetical protein Tco_1504172 [Tanacetum coccineum]